MKNSEPIIEQNNLCYQLLYIKGKLNWIVSDPERFRLTQQYRQKKTRLKEVVSEVKNLFDEIL